MASKWRQNVADLGWAGGGIELLARTPSAHLGQEWFLAKPENFLGFVYLMYRLVGTNDVPQPFATFGVSGAFPYGEPVEPDH